MPGHPQRFWLAAVLAAWSADFLFWNKPLGVSILIFIALAAAAGWWLAQSEGVRPNWTARFVVGLALVSAGLNLWRAEPLTRLLNGFLAFAMLGLLVISLRSSTWLRFGFLDYLVAGLTAFAAALLRGARIPMFPKETEEAPARGGGFRRAARASAPVFRGLLLAVPVVGVFGGLLAAADPIFSDALSNLFRVIDLKRLPEYLVRLVNILFVAYIFTGTLLHAVVPEESSANRGLVAGIPRFLGSTEAFVVLFSVNLLFAAFVAVQFRYFFGGQANITAAGYTYSQYARRGFFELVTVAVLSLGMIAALGTVTRRELPGQFRTFTALSGLLVVLVGVMLVSAFMRLQLYEEAYGFTRLRTYTHLFIPWLGVLLLATVVLQVLRRERFFALAVLMSAVAFTFTLALVNVDGMIADLNIRRANQGAELDASYLADLSDDAIPPLVRHFQLSSTAGPLRDQLGAVLSCRVHDMAGEASQPWQSYHPGTASARSQLVGVDLSEYQVTKNSYGGYAVRYDGGMLECIRTSGLD